MHERVNIIVATQANTPQQLTRHRRHIDRKDQHTKSEDFEESILHLARHIHRMDPVQQEDIRTNKTRKSIRRWARNIDRDHWSIDRSQPIGGCSDWLAGWLAGGRPLITHFRRCDNDDGGDDDDDDDNDDDDETSGGTGHGGEGTASYLAGHGH
ncbi:unnamed protein product [Angiostrongylus costaricensis]|uniref:Uncharacterized protein n=1 Tax=Angiostrongylus costaricensis TaxID=334426 RepID=A0A0R3PCZ3_ANGCS|nr:unnamed protein product [Angiostrongylus costaricensis]